MATPIKTIADFVVDGNSDPFVLALPNGGFRIGRTRDFGSNENVDSAEYIGLGLFRSTQAHSESNQTETSQQGSAAQLADGGYVVVWQTAPANAGGNFYDIRMEIYYADGSIRLADTVVAASGGSAGGQTDAMIAANPVYGFAILNVDSYLQQLELRIFDDSGVLIADVIPANPSGNPYDLNSPANRYVPHDIIALSNGDYVVVYGTDFDGGTGSSGLEVFGQIYSRFGDPLNSPFEIAPSYQAQTPRGVALSDGRFAVSIVEVGAGNRAVLTIYNADGTVSVPGFEFAAGISGGFEGAEVEIAELLDGRLIAVWVDGASGNIVGQLISTNGTLDGALFQINTVTNGTQGRLSIDVLVDGRFVVAWESDEAGSPQIIATVFDPREAGIQVNGTTGNDIYLGSAFNDVLSGGNGNDDLRGEAGFDVLAGGDGNDTLDGGADADQIFGGRGNDALNGGTANDLLVGGAGADALDGGANWDTADYTGSAGGVQVNLFYGVGLLNDAQGDTYSSVENVWGSEFNDIIRGTTGANILEGRGGGDQLLADAGNDILRGGGGNDILRGGAGADQIEGGSGFDVADYTDSNARVLVNLFFNNALEGHAQGDTFVSIESVFGSAFDDIMRGSTGNNALRGNGGNDTLTGDGGADLFQYADTNWGQDLITDFTDGVDLLDLRGSGLTFGSLTIAVSGGDTFVSITGLPGQAIKLDNFVGTLNASDFLF